MRSFIIFWSIAAIFLFLYSFTQVDLSLTLNSSSIPAQIQHAFQYIGWFRRDLSTYLYIGIILLLTILYIWTVFTVSKNKLTRQTLAISIIVISTILTLSYAAFSYDIFNYIFDAKIVTHYHLNPYLKKALDFPGDPMLSFMRSTHRVYPYGPSWLLITVPLSFIGMNIFAITFFLFKILGTVSYLTTCYFLHATSKKLGLKNPFLAVSLFAFNPLVIIEGLVSSHNEIVMMAIAMGAFYLLVTHKKILSLLLLILSIGIKYTTVFLLPIFLAVFIPTKYFSKERLIPISSILMTFAVIATAAASGQNKNPEFQPWYLLSLAPFVSLFENRKVRFVFITVSIVSLISYVPFLWTGSWPVDIVMIKNVLVGVGIVIGLISVLLVSQMNKK